MTEKPGLTFHAAFAPGRKCLQLDAEGECTITLVIPESDAPKITAAFPILRDEAFLVTINARAGA